MTELQDTIDRLRSALADQVTAAPRVLADVQAALAQQTASIQAALTLALKAAELAAGQPPAPPPPPPPPAPVVPAGTNRVIIGGASYPVAAIDPRPDTHPAGFQDPSWHGRGPDELVVFTKPGPGATDGRTGVNQYGSEAPVTAGVLGTLTLGTLTVGRAGGSVIPAGAAVLSGNGAADNYLRGRKPGDVVVFSRVDTPPGPNPPTPPAARMRMMWQFPAAWGGPPVSSWPDDVLASLTHVGCTMAQSAAAGTGRLTTPPDLNAATATFLRSHGIKVGGVVGGSNDGGIAVTNAQQASEFVASVKAWGVDYVDVDLEPSGSNWTQAALLPALQQLAAAGMGIVVTSGLYDPWTAHWGAVCKALGSSLWAWVAMCYDFPEAGDSRLSGVTVDKARMMRQYVSDQQIVLGYMPRPPEGYANASPPGIIPAAYVSGRAVDQAAGWALWESKISAATSWQDLRALAKI